MIAIYASKYDLLANVATTASSWTFYETLAKAEFVILERVRSTLTSVQGFPTITGDHIK